MTSTAHTRADTPLHKLLADGPAALSDAELLSIVLGSRVAGSKALEVSKKVLRTVRDIGLADIVLRDLQETHNLSRSSAAKLLAILELSRRLSGV